MRRPEKLPFHLVQPSEEIRPFSQCAAGIVRVVCDVCCALFESLRRQFVSQQLGFQCRDNQAQMSIEWIGLTYFKQDIHDLLLFE
jgi:hypothetical protein